MERFWRGMKPFADFIPASAGNNFPRGLADPRKNRNALSSVSTVNVFFIMFTAARSSFSVPVHPPPSNTSWRPVVVKSNLTIFVIRGV
jgi:hypothetical protein